MFAIFNSVCVLIVPSMTKRKEIKIFRQTKHSVQPYPNPHLPQTFPNNLPVSNSSVETVRTPSRTQPLSQPRSMTVTRRGTTPTGQGSTPFSPHPSQPSRSSTSLPRTCRTRTSTLDGRTRVSCSYLSLARAFTSGLRCSIGAARRRFFPTFLLRRACLPSALSLRSVLGCLDRPYSAHLSPSPTSVERQGLTACRRISAVRMCACAGAGATARCSEYPDGAGYAVGPAGKAQGPRA
jgi:hypothetical protein